MELAMQPLNSWQSFCLSSPNAGIKSKCHHSWLRSVLYRSCSKTSYCVSAEVQMGSICIKREAAVCRYQGILKILSYLSVQCHLTPLTLDVIWGGEGTGDRPLLSSQVVRNKTCCAERPGTKINS